jgi:hypothetical protein
MAAPIEITTADDATKLGIRTALGTAPIMNPEFIGSVTTTGTIGLKSGSYTASVSPMTLTASRTIILPDAPISISGYIAVDGSISSVGNLDFGGSLITNGGSLTINMTGDSVITLPTSGTLATLAGTETLTNKTISGASNTLTNLNASNISTGTLSATRIADNSLSIAKTSGLQTALDAKAPLASPTFTGTVSGVTSSMVGLGNIDNTSDANKPVSSAQQTALNLKANSASPTLTGNTTITGSGSAFTPTSIVSGAVFAGISTLATTPKQLIQPAFNIYTVVTGVAATGIITVTGHAFANGDTVGFSAISGGAGLSIATRYFVVSVSGSTFQLSLTSGGAAIIFSSNITAGTITNFGSWNINGTMLGVNAAPAFTGDLINLEKDGTSGFKVDSTGTTTCSGFISNGGVTLSGGSSISFSGRSRIKSAADGEISFRNNADSSNANITAGNITASGTATASGGIIYGTFTVGTFPTTTYLEAVVTDALAPTQGATVVAGGSAKCKVMYNGTAKIVTAVL